MQSLPIFSDWLLHAALWSLAILALGWIATLCVRQPIHKVRIISWTMAGCLLAPGLSFIPGYPHYSLPEAPLVREISQAEIRKLHSPGFPRDISPEPQLTKPADIVELSSEPENTTPISPSISAPSEMINADAAPTELIEEPAVNSAPTSEIFPLRLSGREIALLQEAVIIGYLAGLAVFSAWALLGLLGLWRIVSRSRPAPDHWYQLLGEIRGSAGSRVNGAKVKLLTSEQIAHPFTFTFLLPTIVLPAQLCHDSDQQQLRWSLAHEWAHIERRDFSCWLLAGAVRIVFFYQPLAWLLRRRLQLAQDYLADAQAANCGDGAEDDRAEDYAQFLTDQAALPTGALFLGLGSPGLGMSGKKSDLYRRVFMLVKKTRPLASRCSLRWNLTVAIVAVCLVLGIAMLRKDSLIEAVAADGELTLEPFAEEAAPKSKNKTTAKKRNKKDLRYQGKDFAQWRDVLENDLDSATRKSALKALRTFALHGYAQEAIAAITLVVDEKPPTNSNVGEPLLNEAMEALFVCGDAAIPALIKLADEGVEWSESSQTGWGPTVRFNAIGYLGSMGAKARSATDVIVKFANETDSPSKKGTALNALNMIDPPAEKVIPLLTKTLREDPPENKNMADHRLPAAILLVKVGNAEQAKLSKPVLLRHLETGIKDFKTKPNSQIRGIGGGGGGFGFRGAYIDPEAVDALGKIGGEEAIPLLKELSTLKTTQPAYFGSNQQTESALSKRAKAALKKITGEKPVEEKPEP